MSISSKTKTIFKEMFATEPIMVIAPGRVNLIGEHTDYNEGFVMPAAVDKHIAFAIAPNQADRFNFYSIDFDESISFQLGELTPGDSWFHYLMGVIQALKVQGLPVRGVDAVIGGNIPTGGGMSSSAALCCGFAFGLNEIFGFQLSRLQLAKVAQYSEHHFAGVMCGLMDQYASLFGQKNAALLLDCRTLTHELLPMEIHGVEFLLIDTKVKHSLASSAYNQRRSACEEGVSQLQKIKPEIKSLRDATLHDLELIRPHVNPDVLIKCGFVVKEISRTLQAAELIRAQDLKGFGKLMFETHEGLSKEYEVSCPESDLLVEMARTFPGVYGARQMGGGFGGCTINLLQKESIESFSSMIREKYVATFKKEPDFYLVTLKEGVHLRS